MPTPETLPQLIPSGGEKKSSARARLLAALQAAPRLSRQEAERIQAAIQESREASLADGLSA